MKAVSLQRQAGSRCPCAWRAPSDNVVRMQTRTEARLLRGSRCPAFAFAGGVAAPDYSFPRAGPPTASSAGTRAAALALFAAALWAVTDHVRTGRSSRWGLALLTAQLPACWVAPPALVVVAFEAPFVLGEVDLPRGLAVQAITTVGLLTMRPDAPFVALPAFAALPIPIAAGLRGFCWLAAQMLVAAAAVLGAQALRSRRERARGRAIGHGARGHANAARRGLSARGTRAALRRGRPGDGAPAHRARPAARARGRDRVCSRGRADAVGPGRRPSPPARRSSAERP